MSAESVLLDLIIDSSRISTSSGQKDVISLLEQGLLEYFPQLKLIFETSAADGHLFVFSQNGTSFLHVRFFNHGIITINIEYFKSESEELLISFDVSTLANPFLPLRSVDLTVSLYFFHALLCSINCW